MNERDDGHTDDELMAKAARLATEVRPARDLWPGIEQGIRAQSGRQAQGRPAWQSAFARAAAVFLLVGGSSGITWYAMKGGDEQSVNPVADVGPLVFERASADFGGHYSLGPDYTDARRLLTGNLEEQLAVLSPEARQEVLTNMETIRKAIDDINTALANDPDNVLLQQLLLNTYRDELAVMRQVDVISSAAMFRGDI